MPPASATASPPLLPPGLNDASKALTVAPWRALSVCQRSARSGRLVRAIGIAPAARRWAMCGASRSTATPPRIPSEVTVPATSMFSLTVNGTPSNGGAGSPRTTSASAASAAASASSASAIVTALSAGLSSWIRSRWLWTVSRADCSPVAIARASSARPTPALLAGVDGRRVGERGAARDGGGGLAAQDPLDRRLELLPGQRARDRRHRRDHVRDVPRGELRTQGASDKATKFVVEIGDDEQHELVA